MGEAERSGQSLGELADELREVHSDLLDYYENDRAKPLSFDRLKRAITTVRWAHDLIKLVQQQEVEAVRQLIEEREDDVGT